MDHPDYPMRAYVTSGGRLHCVHNLDGPMTIEALGPIDEVVASSRQLDRLLRSILWSGSSPSRLRRLEQRANELDRLLGMPGGGGEPGVEPGRVDAAGSASPELVIVLPPTVGSIPLGALPSLAGRPVLTATSLRPAPGPGRRLSSVAAVAGPDLVEAAGEARAVAELYRRGAVLMGDEADCASTMTTLEGADVAHVAAHGRRSPDNPYFDALELADGPLFTYELEWLRRPPAVMVLASCESAVDQAVGEAQRLGVVPALDRVGVWRTIAAPYPLPDHEATVAVMTDLHRRLAAGVDPAVALAAATRPEADDDARQWAIAASLVCRGRPGV
jgi:hypothetical protein